MSRYVMKDKSTLRVCMKYRQLTVMSEKLSIILPVLKHAKVSQKNDS